MSSQLKRDRRNDSFGTRYWRTFALATAAAALVAILVGREELDAWRLAALEQRWIAGEKAEVIEPLADIARRSNRPDLLADVAQRALVVNQVELALQLAREGRERFAGTRQATGGVAWSFAQIEAFALLQGGRNEEAVDLCRPFASDPALADSPDFLNGYAYIRSLAGIDLEAALDDVTRAAERLPSQDFDLQHRLALLAWDAQRPEEALDWINQALASFTPIYRRYEREFDDRIAILIATSEPDAERTRAEIAKLRETRDDLERRWSSLHAHRAQWLMAAGRQDEAQRDREIVQAAGGEPEREANLRFRVDDLAMQSAYLDTRGWILYRQGKAELAIQALDRAVELARWIDAAEGLRIETEIQRIVRSEDVQEARHESRRGLATLRYHRSVVLRELGRAAEAEQEEREIVALGFQVGPHLY